jgi:hypothetical protein
LKALSSSAAALRLLCVAGGGQALAAPSDAIAAQAIGGVETSPRGPVFAAEDLVTQAIGSLSTPRFDASAGAFGGDSGQPAIETPESLSGTYTAPPTAREVSASVLIAESPDGDAGFPPAADPAASQGMAGRLAAANAAGGSGGGATPSATVQNAVSLTAYQALAGHSAPHAAGATIESYSIASVGKPGSVLMPIRIASSSYGFLNSSLTVFSDDFGSFAGVGQTFNGLTSLDIDEPASILVLLGSLAGIAAVLRHRRRV